MARSFEMNRDCTGPDQGPKGDPQMLKGSRKRANQSPGVVNESVLHFPAICVSTSQADLTLKQEIIEKPPVGRVGFRVPQSCATQDAIVQHS
jgi:hypothetical protein